MMGKSEVISLNPNVHGWKIFNATTLKLLAVILMFIDHIHQMFVHIGAPMWLTMAGRLVFPIFLFTASESFHYTHSKKKYLNRLLLTSWGMTIFTFLLQIIIPNENVILMNNAFSTFFVAGLYMLFWDYLIDGIQKRSPRQIVKSIFCCFIPILCALPIYLVAVLSFNESVPAGLIRFLAAISLLFPNILTVEGGFAFVMLGVAFYIFSNHRILQVAILLILSGITYVVDGGFQWIMCFASLPIALYNGEPGHGMKNFFYIFYPVHIVLLYIVSAFLI